MVQLLSEDDLLVHRPFHGILKRDRDVILRSNLHHPRLYTRVRSVNDPSVIGRSMFDINIEGDRGRKYDIFMLPCIINQSAL